MTTNETIISDAGTKRPNPWRPARHFRIAAQVAELFTDLIPGDVAELAVATCRITVQGPKSVGTERKGKNWGEWVRTRMQTLGRAVKGYGDGGDLAMQTAGKWQSFDSRRIVSDLLDCMGVTMDDFWDEYGRPEVGQKYSLDLPDILMRLAGVTDDKTAEVVAA